MIIGIASGFERIEGGGVVAKGPITFIQEAEGIPEWFGVGDLFFRNLGGGQFIKYSRHVGGPSQTTITAEEFEQAWGAFKRRDKAETKGYEEP